jgi:hypothetical protein
MSQSIFNGAYETRVVTFIDLLGFSNDVNLIDQSPPLVLSIEAVLRNFVKCRKDLEHARHSKGVRHDARMTCFSDCIALSYNFEVGSVLRAMSDAAFVSLVALGGGYLPRGAITLGKLIHTDDLIFGRGLNDAAYAEKNAVVPKIVLSNECRDVAMREIENLNGDVWQFIRADCSSSYVHVLGTAWPHIKTIKDDLHTGRVDSDAYLDMFEEQRKALPIRYKNNDSYVRKKIEWMCQ